MSAAVGLFAAVDDAPLRACLDFIARADALKKVLRRTYVINRERRENSAEHSWHLALMAMALAPYADAPLDLARVLKMLVLHDLGEIEIGDTFFYDAARDDAQAREKAAIETLFASLPEETRAEFSALWSEMAEGDTPEAKFARAMDRFEPFISNLGSEGGTWKDHRLTREKVVEKNAGIAEGSARIWQAYLALSDQAEADGLFFVKDEDKASA